MANVTILDTGYISVNQAGTQLSTANRFNAGSACTIKGISIDYDLAASVDDPVYPASYDGGPTNVCAVGNPKIVLKGLVKLNSSSDVTTLGILPNLIKTKGLKCIYYNSSTDGAVLVTDTLGVDDNSSYSSHPTYKHWHCRFTRFTLKQTPANAIFFTVEGVITK